MDSPFPFSTSLAVASDGDPPTSNIAIVQPNTEERQRTVISLLRSKTPVALLGVTDNLLDFLSYAAQAAHRNHLPLIILGSWRFIPAAAAIKEIISSNCLGNLSSITATPVSSTAANMFRNDLANWLAPDIPIVDDNTLPAYAMRISVIGSAGSTTADFSLDGTSATMNVAILGKSRTRPLPIANPLESELAVLKLYLQSTPKLKRLPLLMTL